MACLVVPNHGNQQRSHTAFSSCGIPFAHFFFWQRIITGALIILIVYFDQLRRRAGASSQE